MDSKFDLKKLNKALFQGKAGEVKEVFCKKAYYITLDGVGNPATDQRYHQGIETLYSLAYTLKFMYKQKDLDFVVMPLSTLWWRDSGENLTPENKNTWNWRAMIELPSYVTEESITLAKEKAGKKEEGTLARAILPREMNEGNAFQVLHVGGYDESSACIEALHHAIRAAGYPCRGKHHEIYLNDPRKVEKSKLKTLIRQPVCKEAEEVLDSAVCRWYMVN